MTDSDVWARWLLDTRFGDDEARRVEVSEEVQTFRDRVLDGAEIRDGDQS